MEEPFEILNDTELLIRGAISRPKDRGKFPLAVIANGFFHTTESPNVKEAARLLLNAGFAVTRFDFTSSFGKSEGRAADITISQQVRDLARVVEYCKRRAYINDKKVSIIGFGLGATTAMILEAFDPMVKALVLVNTPRGVNTISWTNFADRDMMTIKLKRYFHVPYGEGQALINYTYFEDGDKVDIARCARNLKTPTFFISGAENTTVTPDQTQWLFDRVHGKKRMELIPGLGAIESRAGVKAVVELAVPFLKQHKAA